MAAGGVDNPKLLLSSRKRTPDGIGNQFDLVGRYFMEHPRLARGHVEWRDMDHLPLFKRVRLGDGASRIAFALSEETIRTEELLNCMALLTPSNVLAASETRRSLAIIRDRLRGDLESYDEPALSHVAALLARPLESARFGIALTRGKEAMRVHRVSLTVEQEPRPSSRVSLSQSLDAFGFPVPSLHWDLGDLEVRTMRALQEAMNGDLQDVGFGKVVGLLGDEVPRRRLRGEWHQMGTTRMGHTPRSGVVDPQGKVHGIANLFMAGGSVFPTVGYANPTLTIVALSLRLARHLGKALEGGPALGSFW